MNKQAGEIKDISFPSESRAAGSGTRSGPDMTSDLLTGAAGTLFEKLDWPGPEDEAWRRTPLTRLLPKGALDAVSSLPVRDTADDKESRTPLLPDNYAARIITEGGIPVAMAVSRRATEAGLAVEWAAPDSLPAALEAEGRAELDAAADRITAWHWRDMPGSLVIHMPGNSLLEDPVVIEERLMAGSDSSGAPLSIPHLHIDVGESASVEVVWSLEGAPRFDSASLTTMVNAGLSVRVEANGKAGITLRQNLGVHTACFIHDRFHLERDARMVFRESHLGGGLVKTRARAILAGEGSDARLKGLFVAGEGRHMDIGTIQEHRSPRATSDALYKGAVHPGGRSIFAGLIEVAPKAAQTDAYLTNKNLVLGEGARADSIPQLNILTDDVKCSHGSTTGKLEEGQLFYLQSRGFSPREAARELTRGFLAEVIDKAPDAVAEILAMDLDYALADG